LKLNKIILGSFTALITFAVIVYVIENEKSLLELLMGFMLFIFPITFISSFKNTVPAFLLVFFTSLYLYFGIYKYEYYDTLLGLLLAIVIGSSISYFRIHKYILFSPDKYKEDAIKSKGKS